MKNICPVGCNESSVTSVFKPKNQPLARYGLCESEKRSAEVTLYPVDIHACQNCGVMFNESFDYNLVDYTSESVQESRVFSPRIHSYMTEKFSELDSTINLIGEEVLEIGCGEGFFLSKFNKNSVTRAFEPSTEGHEALKLGINVIPRYYDPESDWGKQTPKLIILRQVLEHLSEPKIFFESFAKMLKNQNKNGYLYIEVPNSNTTLRHDRFYDFYFEHYLYFTTASLSLLAERAGFIVKYCREEFDDEIISMLCQVRPGDEANSTFDKKLDKVKSCINSLIADDKKVVAWGSAGTGASLLNMCGFDAEKIPYVIDSDQRKQGLYMPGTGQVVVCPEFLSECPPDAVVILSQFHKKDITDQIRQSYGENTQIIVPDEI